MSKIQAFPDNFVFHIMERWKITIKGGHRVGQQLTDDELELVRGSAAFSRGFSEQLMNGMAQEAAADASEQNAQAPL